MGGGSWTTKAFDNYTRSAYGVSATSFSTSNYSTTDIYTSCQISDVLNPKNIRRLCRDNEEHPKTLPVILALDVTGSMGAAARKVAQKLNDIMTQLYQDDTIQDIEFCIMGIGDTECDRAPIQMSQFESDIRIAEQLGAIYFEGCGGGNGHESYSAAWYMGSRHCDLDCWNRGEKGIIITLGDECPNEVLYRNKINMFTGDHVEADVKTPELLAETKEKFNVYHISVDDPDSCYRVHNVRHSLDNAWKELLGENCYFIANLDNLTNIIVNIIQANANNITINEFDGAADIQVDDDGAVRW